MKAAGMSIRESPERERSQTASTSQKAALADG